MGVWHISGMGMSPGAVTVPLTYVYLTLKAAFKGNKKAREFFEFSGEMEQELKGAPEYLLVFTSKEVITGKRDGEVWDRWERNEIRDEWFRTRKQTTAPKTISRYLSNMFKQLKDEDFREFYEEEWLRDIYFIEVNHENFDDCFFKIGVTLNALKEKEVWINMIGGTNQINIALLTTSSFSAIAARYYYVFQSDIKLLHPEVDKPDLKNPEDFIRYLNKWHDFPIFQLDVGEVVRRLDDLFQRRSIVNIREIERILEEMGYSRQYVAKLRGKLIKISGEMVSKGHLLDILKNMKKKIEGLEIGNFSRWKEWARNEGIIWRVSLDGSQEKL